MGRDEALRDQRLVFYQQDVEAFDSELDAFLELSKASCALLIDRDGHHVTRRGEPLSASDDSLSALIAGSFAATREMARLLGEDAFNVLFHQGAHRSIQLQLVGERTLLAILFDDRTNLGLVRFYARETVRRIGEVLSRISEEEREATLEPGFSADAAAALDELF